MSILDYEYVLASIHPLSCWNLYPTLEAARADQARANAGDPNKTYEPMTYTAYKTAEREVMLGDAPVEITRAKFWEMLEVLPPLKWEDRGGFESFLMSEFTSGPYTQQYVRRGDRYYCKTVDATDRSTWMKAEDR
jgi:hypothetical protein